MKFWSCSYLHNQVLANGMSYCLLFLNLLHMAKFSFMFWGCTVGLLYATDIMLVNALFMAVLIFDFFSKTRWPQCAFLFYPLKSHPQQTFIASFNTLAHNGSAYDTIPMNNFRLFKRKMATMDVCF